MALVGNMLDTAFAGNPSSVNYAMFVAAFSMLSLIYLVLVAFNESFMGHRIIPIVLDALNTIFFFCAAIALAAALGVHSCGNNVGISTDISEIYLLIYSKRYTLTNHVTNGSHNRAKRCHEAQAVDAFLWFGFACYCVSLVFSIFASRGSVNLSGIRKGGPAMSQVSRA